MKALNPISPQGIQPQDLLTKIADGWCGNRTLHGAGSHPAQTMTNKERNKSSVSPVFHEDFGITDIISQVIAKLSENGSNISTEVMEVGAILEHLGSLKAFDH